MKTGWWLLAGSILSCAAIVAMLGDEGDLRRAVWLGMLGPLVATLCAMVAMNRAYRRSPASLTGVMIKAFVAKMVFFGGYVALVVKSGWVRPVPFAVSFTGYFLVLHMIEAFRLRRLFANT
jgi:drug/metabolite transporter (DMT)-like permease